MASSEAFIPVSTQEDEGYAVPIYSADGPEDGPDGVFGAASGSAAPPTLPTSGGGQNHLYFNCCCDCRRAVLIVNFVSIILNIIEIVVVNVGLSYMLNNPDSVEANMNDMDKEKFEMVVKSGRIQFVEAAVDAFLFIAMLLHVCGIYGALKFQKWGVATGGSAYVINVIFGILGLNIPKILLAVALGYPHYFLIKEINEGTMTDYNYHNVAACCGGA